MFKFLRRNKKGFTLIELIVVIAILAILAAIAIPSFMGITEDANNNVEIANAKIIATALNAHNALNPDNQITDESNWASVDANLKPAGIDDDTEILKRIEYKDNAFVIVEKAED